MILHATALLSIEAFYILYLTSVVVQKKRLNFIEKNVDIIFSLYAESSWCMNELAKIKELADKEKLHVVPIFYKLKVGDVRGQTGKFGTKFWNLARASTGDQIKTWKEALECISDKMGLSLKDQSSEADFVKEIVTEVRRVVAAMGLEEGRDHNVNHSGNKKRGWEFQF
ncbi:BnaA02g36870D [Brassica napus]|uniref:BnaA02g36870D protein n=1 Tax=Brassica napus TaxID=3708 RepID=A0A078IVC7_BRANA|nr:BnaA02g36870D [Brassica napus]